jgi:Ca-activated chloride channel family protein
VPLTDTSNNFRFATGVAEFGLILQESKFKAQANYAQVLSLLEKAKGIDQYGRRSRFISLVKKTKALSEGDLQ